MKRPPVMAWSFALSAVLSGGVTIGRGQIPLLGWALVVIGCAVVMTDRVLSDEPASTQESTEEQP